MVSVLEILPEEVLLNEAAKLIERSSKQGISLKEASLFSAIPLRPYLLMMVNQEGYPENFTWPDALEVWPNLDE